MSRRRERLALAAGVVAMTLAAAGGLTYRELQPEPVAALPPGFGPGPVAAGTPRTAGWAEAVVGLSPGVRQASQNLCNAGQVECLEIVVAEMEARLNELGCAHTAPFAFTYLEMTRGVHDRVATAGFFADPSGVSNLDALFAKLYFDAADNWASGRRGDVPPVWQMAFEAADQRAVNAATDLLLGMNAHISRDLAYVVAMLTEASAGFGESAADFDRINEVIDAVSGPMLASSARRYDPAIAELDGSVAPDIDAVELIARWRREAFRLGVQLANADGDEDRVAATAEIERTAVAAAAVLLNADSAIDVGLPADDRLAYCDEHLADR